MKIGVLLKQVPATDAAIKISDPTAGPELGEAKWELNPYDEYALEAALRLKDAKVASEVVIFTVGAKDTEAKVREGLARGADRAVRLDDAGFAGSDCLGIARVLAAGVKAEDVQLVFAGKQAVDGDNAQVPSMVAELLGWPQVNVVTKFELDGTSFKAWRDAGGGSSHVIGGTLPAVITADKGLNEPRYASLKGIMMAKRKKIAVLGAGDLGVDAGQVGAGAAMVTESNWSMPPARPAGRILDGDAASVAKQLVGLLRDEAKVL